MKSTSSFPARGLTAAVLIAGLSVVATGSLAQTTSQPSSGMSATQPAGKSVPPGKSETPDSAFKKLDPNSKGFVSKEDTAQLAGFDTAFQRADADNDGKLSQSEFNQAWSIYSGAAK